jgi:hypothetical protein
MSAERPFHSVHIEMLTLRVIGKLQEVQKLPSDVVRIIAACALTSIGNIVFMPTC